MLTREWASAAELAAMKLPGIPTGKKNVLRHADRDGWQSRPRQARGGGREFHVSSLPVEARTAFISRQLGIPPKASAKAARSHDVELRRRLVAAATTELSEIKALLGLLGQVAQRAQRLEALIEEMRKSC